MASKAQPIPEGFTTVTPHLVVQGAAKAIDFYKNAFGAEEIVRVPGPDDSGKLIHACVQIGDAMVMLADDFVGCSMAPDGSGNTPVTVHLFVPDTDATIAKAVEHGAKVVMPAMDMFWGDRYGQIVDPFGHRWSVGTHQRDLTPEQITEGAKAMFAEHAKMAG